MEKKTKPVPQGNIDINEIIKATKEAATACYGVVAIAETSEKKRMRSM